MVHSRRRQDRRKVFMRKQIGGTGTYPVYGVFRKVYVKLEKRTLGKFEIGLFFRKNLSKDKVAKLIFSLLNSNINCIIILILKIILRWIYIIKNFCEIVQKFESYGKTLIKCFYWNKSLIKRNISKVLINKLKFEFEFKVGTNLLQGGPINFIKLSKNVLSLTNRIKHSIKRKHIYLYHIYYAIFIYYAIRQFNNTHPVFSGFA